MVITEDLKDIIKTKGNQVLTRESTIIEFKESFNWASKHEYGKIISSFANNKGGWIIFGIKDRPHEIVGLRNNKLENFDEAKITGFLNDFFSPEIHWEKFVFELNGKNLGVIRAYEAEEKPIICKKNGGNDLKEGDIYYRYRGRSERIKYSELKSLLDKEKEKPLNDLYKLLSQIIRREAGKLAIVDINRGKILGRGGTIIIDEELVSKLRFVTEGKFSDTEGEPVYRLVGDVKDARIIRYPTQIRTPDIIKVFLKGQIPENIDPIEYIKQLPYEISAFLPIYFFLRKANIPKKEAIKLLNNLKSTMPSKKKLIERLKKEKNFRRGSLTARSKQAKMRMDFRRRMLEGTITKQDIDENNLKYFLEAITHLTSEELRSTRTLIFTLMEYIFDTYYPNSRYTSDIRYTLCYLDVMLYGRMMNEHNA